MAAQPSATMLARSAADVSTTSPKGPPPPTQASTCESVTFYQTSRSHNSIGMMGQIRRVMKECPPGSPSMSCLGCTAALTSSRYGSLQAHVSILFRRKVGPQSRGIIHWKAFGFGDSRH